MSAIKHFQSALYWVRPVAGWYTSVKQKRSHLQGVFSTKDLSTMAEGASLITLNISVGLMVGMGGLRIKNQGQINN